MIPVAVSARVPGSGTVLDAGTKLEYSCGGVSLEGGRKGPVFPGGGV